MDAIKTGALIAQTRKELGLTQRELAEQIYVSVQAVSKWELGRNFPDLSLMEPLADALGLTVSELLAGARGEFPRDELVRDSMRLGLEQLKPKIRWWRWLFLLAAALLLAVLASLGYVWVRDNTELLPQRETVVRALDTSHRERQVADALNGGSLYLYEVCLADDVTHISLQAELWTCDGLEQSWQLFDGSSNDRKLFGPRRQVLVLSMDLHSAEWSEEEQRWTRIWFDTGINFAGFSYTSALDTITNPYISGGACTDILRGPAAVDPEAGVVLLTSSLGGLDGWTYSPGGTLPPEREGEVDLVVRMYCE